MPPTQVSIRRPGAILAGRELRIFSGFGILAFVNTILPYIVFSSLYLIIPFPRPVVLLIELLPALGIKLLLPHLLHYIPRPTWPILLTGCWALAAIVTDAAPPNVEPPVRILITMLASASAAAAEVSFLSQIRHYGKAGLAGWGAGTGAGGVLCAVMPIILTLRMGMLLRSAVGYVYYLVLAMAVAYFLVLPSPSIPPFESLAPMDKFDSEIESQSISILVVDSPQPDIGFYIRIRQNLELAGKLVRPYMIPLLLAFAVQALVLSGASRASGTSSSFEGYATFSAAYGLAFQLGNFASRSFALLFRTRKLKLILALLGFYSTIAVLNTTFLLTSSPYFVFPLMFHVGLLSGFLYINVFAAVMEYVGRNSDAEGEFALGIVGAGDTVGVLLGSLIGVILEAKLCGLAYRNGRWCSTVR